MTADTSPVFATLLDLLVRLYDLPDPLAPRARALDPAIQVRHPNPWDKPRLVDWVAEHFAPWLPEVEIAFASQPPSCFIAVEQTTLVGFACHDCTRRNFFGPMAVAVTARGRGIGRALLLASLHAMRENGYAYAIIGGAGPVDFYARTVGAVPIEGSSPGIYDFSLARDSGQGLP